MSNDIQLFGLTAADLAASQAAMTQTAAQGASGGGYVKMGRNGSWTVNTAPVGRGTEFAVDPSSFTRGWIAWDDGEKLGEVMGAFTSPPAKPLDDLPWSEQLGFDLIHRKTGVRSAFRTNSYGGNKAVNALVLEIFGRGADELVRAPVAIVTLESESYQHKKYGVTYNPVFAVAEFVGSGDVNAAPLNAVEPPKAATEAPAGRRPRRVRQA